MQGVYGIADGQGPKGDMVEAYRKDIYYPQGIVRVGREIVRIVDNSVLDSYR